MDAFERLGAVADAARVARALRALGERHIPRGPRATTRANPANLTARELDVLALLMEGATNREIADRLFLSVKTAGHHVSAILSKLEVSTRREAAARANELGMLEK
jgi:DNA-binding NarL/FixJ family response regulator